MNITTIILISDVTNSTVHFENISMMPVLPSYLHSVLYSLPFLSLVNFSITSCFSIITLVVAVEHNHIWYVLQTIL